MIKLYTDADLWSAYRQRRTLLGWFLGVTGAWLLLLIGAIVWYTQLPYKDPAGVWIIVAACVLTALYIFFSFPYMGICFKRSNAYCKMLKFISVGLKEYSVLPFAGIEDWTTRDGVDVNVATFSVRNVKRDEEMIRQIYVDGEKDFPAFEEGKTARIVTQGNLLIEYELLPSEPEITGQETDGQTS